MKFSKVFLNKLLNSAINFHNLEPNNNKLPDKLNSINDGIKLFNNVLEFEANKALKNEIAIDEPFLNATNLGTKNPGIIYDKQDTKLLVHKKKKPKIEKTEEQLLKEIENKLKRQEKGKEKKKLREEKKEYKQLNKKKEQLEKKVNRKKKKKKKTELDCQQIHEYNNEIDEIGDEITNNNYYKNKDKYDKEQEVVKQEKEKKKKEREIKKKERIMKKEEKLAKEERMYNEKIYDLINDYEDNIEGSKNDIHTIKIYESPLPYQRHIDSLEYANPNKNLIGTILEGKKPLNNSKLVIFHGPPGTGKTYKLITILKEILQENKRYLLCCPSNIGTINLYNRAKSLNINGSLILGNKKLINNFKEKDNWTPSDQIVFSTVSMRYGRLLRDQKFQTIMIDEAAQLQESWTWGLLREEVNEIYLAGDHHQLPALVSQEGLKLNHSRSLMSRLIDLGYETTFLDVQRRMHPDIVKYSNENFYDNKIKTQYTKKYDIEPLEIIYVDGSEERVRTSYQNLNEANKIIKLVAKLNIEDTIIITPYQAQVKLLKKLDNNLTIHTVDSFQGQEAECIILSIVRTSDIGFWKDYRRLNVAMTRAKHIMRIVTNKKIWEQIKSAV